MDNQVNLLNVPQETNDDICLICHDVLEGHNCYTLPECKHTYHTGCIVTWFRLENQRNCPYCGNKGVNNVSKNPKMPSRWYFRGSKYYSSVGIYQDIIAYSRRKNAPPLLVKVVKELRVLEQKLSDVIDQQKAFDNSINVANKSVKQLRLEYEQLKVKKWDIMRSVRAKQQHIREFPIVPIIIPKSIDLS
jgi:hypothetical protein